MTVLFIGRLEFLAHALINIYKEANFTVQLNDWNDKYLDHIILSKPELIILEITRPERRAFNACQKIKQLCPKQPILLFSTHYREYYFQLSQSCQASGYLHQDLPMTTITQGVQQILKGNTYFPRPEVSNYQSLTQREIHILQLLRLYYKQEEIAEELAISRRTVNNHLANIQEKLETQSSLASVLRAIELGIL
ncbi:MULTISPECIES: response regulator transcription factor [unclassified Streptococcus]|uniref:response regulator transcription factor n=1 Tax=unclassified Streptococcus TaxID=2608887 RepID=UPI0014315D5E|nr:MULTISPECIES: response regulator transcription factor [unclassified Streptococcus]MBF0806773.1 response regulator transcription factor [Streptococcus sp. 19428wA2_WM07]